MAEVKYRQIVFHVDDLRTVEPDAFVDRAVELGCISEARRRELLVKLVDRTPSWYYLDIPIPGDIGSRRGEDTVVFCGEMNTTDNQEWRLTPSTVREFMGVNDG
jgi:hypothetical protein